MRTFPSLCVLVWRAVHRQTRVRAQPATGLEVRGGGRKTLERGMMAVSEKKGEV